MNLFFHSMLANTAIENLKSGISEAKQVGMESIQLIVNWAVVPLVCAVALGFLVFFIFGAIKKHNGRDDYQEDIFKIIVTIVVIAVVASFPSWGWKLIGMSSDTATAASTAAFLLTRM